MPRTRRSVLLAVAALTAAVALTACGRAQPGTAAYVGGSRITEDRVESLFKEAQGTDARIRSVVTRATLVSWLVMVDLGRRAAAKQGTTVPAPDYAGAAATLGLPAGSELVHVYGDWYTTMNALFEAAAPTANPTELDLRAIILGLQRNGQVPPGTPFEEVAPSLRRNPSVLKVVTVRNSLAEVAQERDVVINPRYRPLIASLSDVPLVLATGSDAVADLAVAG
ncbi:hypothetical protein Val02_16910 [Virgisporangium aliadipatigenens]|uniref:ABC transporter substrate-binding protein n=2 Tax=Virgisporangium aliadipatigenens TaxID=741659 RepID=A0A8J3YIZ3_9ACTN|nr:hypothetical protein Val02_16910 [Virgisporangium aliadipatigenens]